MVAIREPESIITSFLRNNLTDLNTSRSGQWVMPQFPETFPASLSKYPVISVHLLSESGEAMGLNDDDFWNNITLQIDVWCKRGQILSKTVTDEAVGTISNSPRLSFDYVPNDATLPVSNIKHDSTGFGTLTKKAHDDDFTSPASLSAGIVEWSVATGNLNFSSADLTSYSGEAITATYTLKLSNASLARWHAREIISKMRGVWRTDLSTKGVVFRPVLISNSPVPFEEEMGMYRRMLEFKHTQLNAGEQ